MENPYQANTQVAISRADAKFFIRTLTIYKKYRGSEMPVLDLIGYYLVRWMISGVFMLLPIGLLQWSFPADSFRLLFAVIAGMFVGQVLRDIYHCRVTNRLWPVIRKVIDWDRLDAQIEELKSA